MNSIRISHTDVSDKKFGRSETGGYNTSEVDNYLDDVVQQLKYYENWYQKYTLLVSNFDAVKQKMAEYEGIINKLKTELEELYSNGYSNKVLMQRLLKVESNQNAVFELQKKIDNINQKIDGIVGLVTNIANLLSRVVYQK